MRPPKCIYLAEKVLSDPQIVVALLNSSECEVTCYKNKMLYFVAGRQKSLSYCVNCLTAFLALTTQKP